MYRLLLKFFNHGFRFQNSVCTCLTIFCLDISHITIITVKGIDYRCIIYDIRKSDAYNLLENLVLDNLGYI